MNIAIFSPSQNPYSETFIQAHKNHLKGNIFYYYGIGDQICLEGFPPLVKPSRGLLQKIVLKLTPSYLKKKSSLKKHPVVTSLFDNKIDVILAEYGTHAHHILPIIKETGLSLVVHFHGYDASINSVVESCNYYKDVFAYSKKIIAVSKKMEAMLLNIGCPTEKLIYNVYGPRNEFLDVLPKFSKKQFIGIGRFTDKKAPYYTIMAFKEVLSKHPDASLLLAGDGMLYNTCKNLINYFHLENNIKLIGVITPEYYAELLEESLAFVQHSITASDGDMEGTPLAILEASLAGLPVISTLHGGIPDVIIHNKTGLLCEEHDVKSMSKHMLQLLNDVDYAKQLGQAGKIHIKSNFSLERHISSLQAVLDTETRVG